MENPSDSVAPKLDDDQFRNFRCAVRNLRNAAWDLDSAVAIESPEALYERVKHAIALGLALIDPTKPYGTELFLALARVGINVAVEMGCVRYQGGTVGAPLEVYLTQRAADDPAFPGEWHCPGSVYRPGEIPADVFHRLEEKEFGCKLTGEPMFVGMCRPQKHGFDPKERGHFMSEVWAGSIAEPGKGTWYPVDKLPENTVASHRDFIIPMAVRGFREAMAMEYIRRPGDPKDD